MSFITTLLTIFIIIPIIPLFAYVIGLLVPASHIVSRTSTFKVSPSRLWQILTNVNEYPQWQPKVEKVIIDRSSNEDQQEETVFVEYSTRKRHTVIIHHERVANQCLLRILEERPVATAPAPSKIPTFSGSWTFELSQEEKNKEEENGDDNQVTVLKITEQGVIKKPLVRVTHLLLFGFHSRIDRFMNDLHKKIDAENNLHHQGDKKETPLVQPQEEVSVEELAITEQEMQPLLAEEVEVEGEEDLNEEKKEETLLSSQNQGNQQVYYSTLFSSVKPSSPQEHQPHQKQQDNTTIEHKNGTSLAPAVGELPSIIGGSNDTTATTDNSQLVDEANDTYMTESKIVDKEWDLMSEIYERTPPSSGGVAGAAASEGNIGDSSEN